MGSDEVRRVVALGKEFHIDCYRCVDCKRCLSDEPEKRCYPFNEPDPGAPGRSVQRMLCLNCHLQRIGAIPATSAGGIVNSNINNNSSTTTNNTISNSSSTIGGTLGGHTKSTSGILNYSMSNNHMNNSGGRYSTMPNRVQASKLNTLNTTSTVSPPSSAPSSSSHHHYPHHQPYQLNTSLTASTYHTTPHIHSAYSTPNSLGVKHRSTNGSNINNNTNTNNYAINWERARMNGANSANHLHHGGESSSRSYHNSSETKS
ncbi:unnamed protein product [Trichobilharzia szidati]|nr:unnamed protein product [Trichobilharzia szidati]